MTCTSSVLMSTPIPTCTSSVTLVTSSYFFYITSGFYISQGCTVVPTEPVSEVEISHSNHMPGAELMQKSCSCMKFAVKLSVKFFNEET